MITRAKELKMCPVKAVVLGLIGSAVFGLVGGVVIGFVSLFLIETALMSSLNSSGLILFGNFICFFPRFPHFCPDTHKGFVALLGGGCHSKSPTYLK